ncbi:MAG TPA: ribonuclease HI family protein [Candidatus Limnocylindrales bacterium]
MGLAEAARPGVRIEGRRRAAGAPVGAEGLNESFWPELERSTTGARGFVIRTDGASRANPGHASAGAVLIDLARPDAFDPAAPADASISDYLGVQTNNVAEYTAVVRALGLARELGAREVRLLLDSMLIVEQLHGRWRVKDAKLAPLHAEARRLLGGLDRWTAAHVRRAENHAADALCNQAIDRALAGGPASVVVRPGG